VAASGETTGLKWTGAYISYTPTFTNLTVGNGTLNCEYAQIGKLVYVRFSLVFGSTTTMGSGPYFTLPVTASSSDLGVLGLNYMEDVGVAGYTGAFVYAGNTLAYLTRASVSGSNVVVSTQITASSPFTWGTNDFIRGQFVYGAA
jgi:hypothetical protein